MKKYVKPSLISPQAKGFVPLIAAAAEGIAAGVGLVLAGKALSKKEPIFEYYPHLEEISNIESCNPNFLKYNSI